jgi:hypothetical protein
VQELNAGPLIITVLLGRVRDVIGRLSDRV